ATPGDGGPAAQQRTAHYPGSRTYEYHGTAGRGHRHPAGMVERMSCIETVALISRCLRGAAAVLLGLGLAGASPAWAQQAQVETAQDYHVELDLLPETLQAEPGTPLWPALRLQHEPRWHTYWVNPGDAG